jgi:hypothetical protein
MAASRPSLKAEIYPLTRATPEDGTHVVRILRGSDKVEVGRDLAATKQKAKALSKAMLAGLRLFYKGQQ